jgi:hypothetical protein
MGAPGQPRWFFASEIQRLRAAQQMQLSGDAATPGLKVLLVIA